MHKQPYGNSEMTEFISISNCPPTASLKTLVINEEKQANKDEKGHNVGQSPLASTNTFREEPILYTGFDHPWKYNDELMPVKAHSMIP